MVFCPMPKAGNMARLWSKRCKGRLKLCTSSLFFEPDDVAQPITRFSFDKMKVASREEVGTRVRNLTHF